MDYKINHFDVLIVCYCDHKHIATHISQTQYVFYVQNLQVQINAVEELYLCVKVTASLLLLTGFGPLCRLLNL